MRTKATYLILIILLSALILSAGCVAAPNFTFSFASLPVANQPLSDITDASSSAALSDVANLISKVSGAVVAVNAELNILDTSGQPITDQIAGSGWILSQSGFVVTSSHVVEGTKNVTVTLENGQTYAARTVSTDPIDDLAVIDIGISNLTGVTMGDSLELNIGAPVIAMGNALGDGIKATQGTICGTDSTFVVDTRETLYHMLETTAPIAHGNSGGPLFNMDGEVIGIVTGACMTRYGVEVAGYAVSSSVAAPIIQQLVRNSYTGSIAGQ
jgi:serine protease Do